MKSLLLRRPPVYDEPGSVGQDICPGEVAALPPLAVLVEEAASRAGVDLVARAYPRGASLFPAGDEIGGLYLIVSGLVASRSILENGREVLVAINGSGDTLGDLEYCLGGGALCGVSALEETATLWAGLPGLDRMVRLDYRLPLAFARILAQRLHRSSQRLTAGLAYPLEYCLLKALLGRLDSPDASRPILRRELAGYLGHTERHVNRLLRSLEAAGVVSAAGAVVALADPEAARARLADLEG